MTRNLFKNPVRLLTAIAVIVAFASIAWWLGSPLFLNQTVNEAFPLSAQATLPADMSRPDAEATLSSAAAGSSTADEAMPDGAINAERLLTGSFRDADAFHRGSGQATIYQLPDGTRILRLENFQVTNGPQLHVYLTAHPDPRSSGEVTGGAGFVDLGPLKGNIGSQNYIIPADVDLSQFNSIVIHCVPFNVVFSVAPLTAPAA